MMKTNNINFGFMLCSKTIVINCDLYSPLNDSGKVASKKKCYISSWEPGDYISNAQWCLEPEKENTTANEQLDELLERTVYVIRQLFLTKNQKKLIENDLNDLKTQFAYYDIEDYTTNYLFVKMSTILFKLLELLNSETEDTNLYHYSEEIINLKTYLDVLAGRRRAWQEIIEEMAAVGTITNKECSQLNENLTSYLTAQSELKRRNENNLKDSSIFYDLSNPLNDSEKVISNVKSYVDNEKPGDHIYNPQGSLESEKKDMSVNEQLDELLEQINFGEHLLILANLDQKEPIENELKELKTQLKNYDIEDYIINHLYIKITKALFGLLMVIYFRPAKDYLHYEETFYIDELLDLKTYLDIVEERETEWQEIIEDLTILDIITNEEYNQFDEDLMGFLTIKHESKKLT